MGFLIFVTVKPRAAKDALERVAESEYRATVHEPAEKGKANQALIGLLAAHFSVPKSAVRIVRGHSSRKKRIEIG
jgi:uncharacterized protein